MTRVLIISFLGLWLTACAGKATLLPQGDHSYKVVAEGGSLKEARRAAEGEAVRTCRKNQKVHRLIWERNAVQDSTEAGSTKYRIIWKFECVEIEY